MLRIATAFGVPGCVLAAIAAMLTWPATACDFCGPANLTLSEELGNSDVAIIATMLKAPERAKDGQNELTRAVFRVDHALKGGDHLAKQKDGSFASVHVLYFGDKGAGTQFLLVGTNPPKISWGGPLVLTKASVEYILKLPKLPNEGADRLVFFQDFLEAKDKLLAQDAFDEFAKAPYSEFKALGPRMNREKILGWLNDKELLSSRKRLYMMLLSVCGKPEDIKMLKDILQEKPKDNEPRLGLEPVIVAYLTLSGNDGMKLIDESFMANKKAHYADMYACIMALRFMGQEQGRIARKRILQSFHHILDRPDFADLVIPDLARWQDWTVMDRLVELFKTAKPESSWVRVPVVQYLSACPLPKAKEHLAALEKIDPEAIKRASLILPFGVRPASQPKAPAPMAEAKDGAGAKPAVKKDAVKTDATQPDAVKKGLSKATAEQPALEQPAPVPPPEPLGKRAESQDSGAKPGPKPRKTSADSASSALQRLGSKALIAICTLGAVSLVMVGIRRARGRRVPG